LYECLSLLHTDKDGSNKAEIEKKIHGSTWTDLTLTQRYWLSAFKGLPAENQKRILDVLGKALGASLHDVKQDTSSSVATVGFVPKVLDQSELTFDKIFARMSGNSSSYINSAHLQNNHFLEYLLDWCSKNPAKVTSVELDRFLNALEITDSPHVVGFLANQLTRTDRPTSFGSQPFHSQLTLMQLEELRKLVPTLIDNRQYVLAMLKRLISSNVDVHKDAARFEGALMPVVNFASLLSPSFHDWKALVLFNLLHAQVLQGKYDETTFRNYIAIPKHCNYTNKDFVQRQSTSGFSIPYVGSVEGLPSLVSPSSTDEGQLVSRFLTQYFVKRPSWEKSFETMIDGGFLRDTFVRAKLFYSDSPDLVKLREMVTNVPGSRVNFNSEKQEIRLEISPGAPRYWSGASNVSLNVEVKNVSKLIVKLFEINTLRYYRDNLAEILSDISLEGLVASEEQQYEYNEADYHSVIREFKFPSLDGRNGVFVIEFVGGGKSVRAVIYKGRLNVVQRPTIAGHVFTVMNEKYEKLPSSNLWMAGHLYHSDEDGEITIPYAATLTERTVVVYGAGDPESTTPPFSDLYRFTHQAESYEFSAQFHVERESLVPFNKTSVLVKPKLLMNSRIVTPVSLLTDVFLSVSTTDLDGISSSKEVPFKFSDDADYVFDFQVPDRLIHVEFSVRAQIKKMSDNSKSNFFASKSYNLNGIDSSDRIEQIFLRKTAGQGYSLHMLGKTGDAVPRAEVYVTMHHSLLRYAGDQSMTLTTDDKGVIVLGPCTDYRHISVGDLSFPLEGAAISNLLSSEVLHLKSGQSLQVAVNTYEVPNDRFEHTHAALLSVNPDHDGVVLTDFFHLLKYEKGMLTVPRGLMPGTYRLRMKRTNREISIVVQQALQSHSGFLFGADHILEKSPFSTPLQIAGVEDDNELVKVQLTNSTSSTRVHLFTAEYVPEYDVRDLLKAVPQPSISRISLGMAKKAQYVSRELSEEQRYVLDRRYEPARQGNTLTPPSLLLNPWAVDSTNTGRKDASGGSGYGSSGPSYDQAYGGFGRQAKDYEGSSVVTNNDRNFDFKFHPCKPVYNLKPDEHGVVTVKRSDLGGTPTAPLAIRVVAVDATEMVIREHSAKATVQGAEPAILAKDLRLKPARALNPVDHFAEQKGITLLQVNEKFTVDDLSTSKIEVLDSMAKVYGFFSTISGNETLKDWNWLLKWGSLSVSEKEEKYHQYASHELHVFLYFKDRVYFNDRILPYLKNKMQKTFIDEWLLNQDPAHFLKYAQPGIFSTLNAAEKALLAHRLAKDEGEALAKSLHDLSTAIAFSKSDRNKFNHLFKTVLGSSSLNTESDGYVPAMELDDEIMEEEELAPVPAPMPVMMTMAAMPPPAARASMAMSAAAPLYFSSDESEYESKESAPRRKRSVAPSPKMMAKRSVVTPLFQAPEKTKKYAESQYYKQANPKQSTTLVSMNAFWSDYAMHRASGKSAFISKNFIYASGTFAEMVLAMAVLDLPLEKPAKNHPTEFSEAGMTLTALAPVIVFHKDVRVCPVEKRPVLVAQNFFDPLDMHTTANGEHVEKYIEEEFLNRKVYGCNYIITNISSSPQRVEVLLQLPVGAVPVNCGSLTKSVFMEVSSYTTQSGQFYFYFPRTGDYDVFPVHVSRDEQTIAWATMTLPEGKPVLHVVDQLHKHDLKSWNSYISQLATNNQVFEYLEKEDIFTVQMERIAWRMRDAAFFKQATDILRKRSVFNGRLWAYSLMHADIQTLTEYFNSERESMVRLVGPNAHFDSFPGFNTNEWETRKSQHYEFWPLINARAHKLGAKRSILNDGFKTTYHEFLTSLAYRSQLTRTDILIACYYMLLQDRIEEGIKLFARASAYPLEAGACPETVQLQVDYLAAYLDFYTEQPTVARTICEKYLQHPVLRWRRMFSDMKKQLEEFDTGVRPSEIADPDDRNQRMGKAANLEPTLDVETVPGKILIHHTALTSATLSFYKMDIEVLFSSADYKPHDLGKFAYVKPNASVTIELAKQGNETAVAIPAELENTNIMIEVLAGPHAKVVSYFSHSLLVKVSQSYGQIQVHDRKTGKPLSRVYVKVFSQNKAGVTSTFYKDGYTDIRGAFDYASLSTDELGSVAKFSILVMSPHNGTRILEAAPPAQ